MKKHRLIWDIIEAADPAILADAGSRRFWRLHRTKTTPDASGNGDDVFAGSKQRHAELRTHGTDGGPRVDETRHEQVEVNELSGKTLGSYIQRAREDATRKTAHRDELNAHPSVQKLRQKRLEYWQRREYDKKGRSKHQDQINNTFAKEHEAKQKLDPNYPRSVDNGRRFRGIDRALKKLQSGKLSEDEITEDKARSNVYIDTNRRKD